MRKFLIILFILILAIYTWGKITGKSFHFGSTTLANQTISGATVFGPFKAAKMKINKLQVYGSAEIDTSTIGESISVKGPLQLYGSKIEGSLEVEGPVELKDSTVNGFTVIRGSLKAADTTFNSFINVTAKKIDLSNVTVNGDIIINGRKIEQILDLSHGTVIKGSVTFKSGMGTIVKGEDSKIEGKIEGVEFKSQ